MREKALRCLAMYCLLDRTTNTVRAHVKIFLEYCRNDNVELVPLETGAGKNRFINTDSPFLMAARKRGINFGDT